MDISHTLAIALGVAWASGINLYAAVLVLGGLDAAGLAELPPGLEFLSSPLVLIAAGIMYGVEFFADKVPGLDSAWDGIHTFVRIPAGAILAAQSFAHIDPAAATAAALVGGSLTAGVHAAKSGTRLVANASPEPVSNWTLSLSEDALVIGGLVGALNYPWLFFGFVAFVLLVLALLLPKLWGVLCATFKWVCNGFRRTNAIPEPE